MFEQNQHDIKPIQSNIGDIKYKLEHDFEFFIQFFLVGHLTVPVPKFHCDVFERMVDPTINRFVCAIPRGHAKTTLAKLAVVWLFLFSKNDFIIYVSNTSIIAVDAVKDIMEFFETENFIAVFGQITYDRKREGDGDYIFTVGNKVCILRARGANQQMRGINIRNRRPQVAVVDDLEDRENIATDILFDKLNTWYHATFMKAMDQFSYKIVHIGNMFNSRCILKNNIKSPSWHSMLMGALLSNGKTLWPDLWPLERLQEDFLDFQMNNLLHLWFAEMMNQPIAAGRGLIDLHSINYAPLVQPGHCEYGFITVDPAISEETWAHKTAIVATGWNGENWQLVDFDLDVGVDPLDLLARAIDMAIKWRFGVIGIESVAYQASLQHLFAYMIERDGIIGIICFPLTTGGRRKTQRLASWAALIKSKDCSLTENDFVATTQLLEYDPMVKNNDDDLIDAASYCVQMLDLYMFEIIESATKAPEMLSKTVSLSSYEVSKV